MAVVVMTIVQIRKCVLKLAREAKVKIPDFPKETQNVENHCISEKFEINGEKFIFSAQGGFSVDSPIRTNRKSLNSPIMTQKNISFLQKTIEIVYSTV